MNSHMDEDYRRDYEIKDHLEAAIAELQWLQRHRPFGSHKRHPSIPSVITWLDEERVRIMQVWN